MGILLRQVPQMYLGELAQTYIFPPQPQIAYPEKRWTALRVGFFTPLPSRMALQRSHSSSETIASTLVQTHSLSGFNCQAPVRSSVWV